MNKNLLLMVVFGVVFLNLSFSQNNNIKINATLNTETHELNIYQEINYFNKSDSILNNIYLSNWPNAYKDKKTPLAQRFVEKNSKSFHFTKSKNRGNSTINTILVDYEVADWKSPNQQPDILNILLKEPLKPNDSAKIIITYVVKIPNSKFTRYGVSSNIYNLRYWYLVPAIFNKKWDTYNNLDLDDLYMDFTDYNISVNVPADYTLNSDLIVSETKNSLQKTYQLIGKNRLDVELSISQYDDFSQYNSKPVSIITNLNSARLNLVVKTTILNRELHFIESYLGAYPHNKLLINKIEYEKDPVYGFNQLPEFLAPFSDNFEWDIKMFKVLARKYITTKFLFNQREDVWLADGLQTYLMMKYIEEYYPEMKAIGNVSKIWGVRSFNLAKIDFNDKYYFIHQFAARKNLDQSLTTPADSLSNFNQKIANKYKAGIGLKYLENYLGEETIKNAIVDFSKNNAIKKTESNTIFNNISTTKNIDWFKNGYIETSKKSDYKIKKVDVINDSIEVTVKNMRDFTVPIELFGIKDSEIKYRKWLTGIDSISKITIPKDGFDKLSLNYQSLLPEYNLRNNWKNVNPTLFTRPLQLKFFKDIENPYYNQLFYTPVFGYNYYSGIILGMAFSNQTFLNKSINFKVTPSYSTKSNAFSGSYSLKYEFLPENKQVNKFVLGVAGNHYDYAPDLPYSKFTPFAFLEFRKKSHRDISSNAISAGYTFVDKAPSPTETQDPETLKYNVFSINYGFSKPNVINDIRLSTGFQMSDKFSKVSLDAHYRILTNTNTQFDFRFFAGAFLTNDTNTDFFSFAMDRPTDYLFQYDYLGRSATTGFLSQQIIIAEGGFKSNLPVQYANQWLTSINTSIGVWRWAEIYNDVALAKNKNQNVYFAYENGVRLNFVQDILEVYFPVYSNLGWEITQTDYASRIRFVLVLNPKRIVNFLRRGFY
ncbi:aminopeptidase [Lutibacter sp. HS1-25]|uniref:aminopeptidase n=1 Tax=Lutibacter sp. HS1-25 TaxID=2485000 RepID=UPI0010100BF8|nr:aminopeptidase [Lutibacter sp. HS1-25]